MIVFFQVERVNSTKPLSKDLVVEVHFFILVITTNDNDIILITLIVDIMIILVLVTIFLVNMHRWTLI